MNRIDIIKFVSGLFFLLLKLCLSMYRQVSNQAGKLALLAIISLLAVVSPT